MSEPFIYCGTGSSGRVDIFDRGENLIKSIDLLRYESSEFRPTSTNLEFGIVNKIKVDSDGCIYVIINYGENSAYEDGGSIRKYGPNGSLKWVRPNMWSCGHLDIDNSGNVYAVTPGVGYPPDYLGSVKKFNNDGELQWVGTSGGLHRDPLANQLLPIKAKSDGSLIVVGSNLLSNDPQKGLVAYDGDGDILWTIQEINTCFAIIIDEDDNDYIYALNGNIYKIDSSDGSIIQTLTSYYDISGVPRSIAKDNNGDFIATMTQVNYKSAFKFDSDLNIIWVGSTTAPTNTISGNSVYDVGCDDDGNIYVINSPSVTLAGLVVRDNDGQPLWVTDPGGYRCLTLAYPTTIPPLDIGIDVGLPSWQGDRYTYSPALSLAIAYGIPLSRRDYLGRPLPLVYRAYLTGTPDLELPISSLQCRRDAAGTSLVLIAPGLDSTTIAAIEDRETGDVVVKRGIRFADGTEQIDEMFRLPLTGLRYDLGSQSGSASLTAADVTPAGGYTRTLTGISYRNTIAANRRIRCTVDTYLLPGDTANLGGGETLTVAEIVYSISPDSASMEVAE